jgi:hypothetical protein
MSQCIRGPDVDRLPTGVHLTFLVYISISHRLQVIRTAVEVVREWFQPLGGVADETC